MAAARGLYRRVMGGCNRVMAVRKGSRLSRSCTKQKGDSCKKGYGWCVSGTVKSIHVPPLPYFGTAANPGSNRNSDANQPFARDYRVGRTLP
jgi:hypothetical protein